MAKKTFFIAGTDTDVGKTIVASGLLLKAGEAGLKTTAVKPVAAGCEESSEGLRNSDALELQQAMSQPLSYEQVNPVALKEAIAPHIAAEHEGRSLAASRLSGFCRGVLLQPSDFVLIEGAGGWRVPLNSRETLADLAIDLKTPVILVVGMKLGCINHALLTVEAIRRDGLPVVGWVANKIDPNMSCYEENRDTLAHFLGAPLLGEIPYMDNPSASLASQYLSLDSLLAK